MMVHFVVKNAFVVYDTRFHSRLLVWADRVASDILPFAACVIGCTWFVHRVDVYCFINQLVVDQVWKVIYLGLRNCLSGFRDWAIIYQHVLASVAINVSSLILKLLSFNLLIFLNLKIGSTIFNGLMLSVILIIGLNVSCIRSKCRIFIKRPVGMRR